MIEHFSIGMFLGYLGIALSLLSTFMRSMQPLRIVAIVGNVAGLTYGFTESVWPTFIGNMLLLPINSMRLWEIRKLIRDMADARKETSIAELLLPHMTARTVKAGEKLFAQGDLADEMLYLQQGQIRLIEAGKLLSAGALFGEVGLFARDSRRSQSAVCETTCVIYSMTRERLYTLYFQNPRIGFNLMGLLVEHLLPGPGPSAAAAAAAAPTTQTQRVQLTADIS